MEIASQNATVRAGQTTRVLLSSSLIHVDDRLLSGITFDFDRIFLKPCAKETLKNFFNDLDLFLIIARANNGGMVVLGHADQTGDPDYNVRLTRRRARMAFAYLTRDVAEWDNLRNDPEEGPNKWETREAQYILQSLGYYRGYVDNQRGNLTIDALRAFTTDTLGSSSITLNDATWLALLTAYMNDGYPSISFDPATDFRTPAHIGCGFHHPRIGAPNQRLEVNRRVEVLMFENDSFTLGPNCNFYPSLHLRHINPPQQNITVDIEIQLQDARGNPVPSLPGLSEIIVHDPRGRKNPSNRSDRIQLQNVSPDGVFRYTLTNQTEGPFELEVAGDFIVFHPDEPEERFFNHLCQDIRSTANQFSAIIRSVLAIERLVTPDRRRPITLNTGDQVTLNVTATPNAVDPQLGQINIVSHDNAGIISTAVMLSVTGNNPAAPNLNVLPSVTLDFGQLTTGVVSDQRLIRVENDGSDDLLNVNAAITGADSGQFTLNSSSALPMTLGPGAHVDLLINFAPTAGGAATAQLDITTGNGGNMNIALRGEGVAGNSSNMFISINRVSFDEATEEATSPPQAIVIRNTGTANLNGLQLALTGTDSNHFAFVARGALPLMLTPGQQTEVYLTFTPDSVTFVPQGGQHHYVANLRITTTNGGNADIPLAGFAVAARKPTLNISARHINFGSIAVGTTSPAQTITVENTGSDLKTIDFQLGGEAAQHFGFTTTPAPAVAEVFESVPISEGVVLAGDRIRIFADIYPAEGLNTYEWSITERGAGLIFDDSGTEEDDHNQVEFTLPDRAIVAEIQCRVIAPSGQSYETRHDFSVVLVRFVRDNNRHIEANRIQIEGILNGDRAGFNPNTDLTANQRNSIVRLAATVPGLTANNFNVVLTSIDSSNNDIADLNITMNRSAGDLFLSDDPIMALTPDNLTPQIAAAHHPLAINAPNLHLLQARAEGTMRVDLSIPVATATQEIQRALQAPVQGRVIVIHIKNVANSTATNGDINDWFNWANAAWGQCGIEVRIAHNTPLAIPDPGTIYNNLPVVAGNALSAIQERLFALNRSQPRHIQIYITRISSSAGLRGQYFSPTNFAPPPSVASTITALSPLQLTDHTQAFGAQRYAGASLLIEPDLFTITQNGPTTLTITAGNLTASHNVSDPYGVIGLNKSGMLMVLANPTKTVGSFETMAHEMGHGLIEVGNEHVDPVTGGALSNDNLMAPGASRNIPTFDLNANQRNEVLNLINKAQGNLILLNFIFVLH